MHGELGRGVRLVRSGRLGRTKRRRRRYLLVTGDGASSDGGRRRCTEAEDDDLDDATDHAGEGKVDGTMRVLTTNTTRRSARSEEA